MAVVAPRISVLLGLPAREPVPEKRKGRAYYMYGGVETTERRGGGERERIEEGLYMPNQQTKTLRAT